MGQNFAHMVTLTAHESLNRSAEIFRPTESRDWLDKISQVAEQSIKMFVGMILVSPILSCLPSARAILPNKVILLSEKCLAVPFRRLADSLLGIFPHVHTTFKHGLKLNTNWTHILVGSALEEVTFRYCIQSLCLKEIPRFMLQKVAPTYAHLIDHKIAKVARTVFTSALFALVHIVRLGNMPGMLLTHFFAGMYFSYMRECGTSITQLSLIHFIVNAITISLAGGIPGLV